MAHPFDQMHERESVLQGQRIDEVVGAFVHVVGGAAGDGEIVSAHRDGPTTDLGQAHDVAPGGEGPEVAVGVVVGRADQRAGLYEAAGHGWDPARPHRAPPQPAS